MPIAPAPCIIGGAMPIAPIMCIFLRQHFFCILCILCIFIFLIILWRTCMPMPMPIARAILRQRRPWRPPPPPPLLRPFFFFFLPSLSLEEDEEEDDEEEEELEDDPEPDELEGVSDLDSLPDESEEEDDVSAAAAAAACCSNALTLSFLPPSSELALSAAAAAAASSCRTLRRCLRAWRTALLARRCALRADLCSTMRRIFSALRRCTRCICARRSMRRAARGRGTRTKRPAAPRPVLLGGLRLPSPRTPTWWPGKASDMSESESSFWCGTARKRQSRPPWPRQSTVSPLTMRRKPFGRTCS